VLSSHPVVASERYERDIRRAFKELREAPEAKQLAGVKPIFFTYVGHIPAPLREEMWVWYVDLYMDQDPRFTGVQGLAMHLSGIIDIFDGAYDPGRSPLGDDEWELVHTLTNEGSPEMPMHTLEYVMQLLMDRGRLG
jgi:hypothetical protein